MNQSVTPGQADESTMQIKMEDEALYGKEAEELMNVEENLGGDERRHSEQEYKVQALGLQLHVTDSFLNIGPIAHIQVCVRMCSCVLRLGGR